MSSGNRRAFRQYYTWLAPLVCLLPHFSFGQPLIPTLTAEEFTSVYRGHESPVTAQKLNAILKFTSRKNIVPALEGRLLPEIGRFDFSLSAFNVEQGRRLDDLLNRIRSNKVSGDSQLWNSDILLLNESDWGTCRAGFRDVATELGKTMNYDVAFGTEFLEVQPERLGLAPGKSTKDCPRPQFRSSAPQVTGNAILSRFPIRSVNRIDLPNCHDWFLEQRDGLVHLEERQTRRGSRMAMVAKIDLPGGKAEDLIVVSAHLENKSWPECRKLQMDFLLGQLSYFHGPLIIGGDLNTWGGRKEDALFRAVEQSGFSLESNDGLPTYVVSKLPLRLDYLLFRKNTGLFVKEARTLKSANIPKPLSDHDPIYSRFQLDFGWTGLKSVSQARP